MIKRIIAATLLLASGSAFTAESMPGFYIRGDAGVAKQINKIRGSGPFIDNTKFKSAPVLGIGAGYRFTERFRAELNFANRHLKYKGSDTDSIVTQKTKSYSVLLNGYYDFKNNSIFTPYVTAGFGISRNVAKNALVDLTPVDAIYKGISTNNFAWNAGLGTKLKLNNKFDLDLGYKYVSMGKIKIGLGNGGELPGQPKKYKFHEVTLGVAYNF